MYYQVKVEYSAVAENGKTVFKSEDYLVDKCVLHGEAEACMLQYAIEHGLEDLDVATVKRSKIKEFVNNDNGEDIYIANIVEFFTDDNGKTKENKCQVGVYAVSVDDAVQIANEYMEQGLEDFQLVGVKKTKIVEVLEYLN